jgi:tetratricopeptide (TPR) repeat protein
MIRPLATVLLVSASLYVSGCRSAGEGGSEPRPGNAGQDYQSRHKTEPSIKDPSTSSADTGEIDRKIAEYDKAIALNPEDSSNYEARGNLFIKQGDYDHGMSDYQKAIDLGMTFVYYERAYRNLDRGYYDLAIADYTKIIDLSPKRPDGYRLRSDAYRIAGNNKQAIADLDREVELAPKELQGYHDRGLLYLETGNYEGALADFNTAIDIEPSWMEEYNNRGSVKFLMGQYLAAMRDFDQVLRMSQESSITTGDATLMYYLSRIRAGEEDETFARRAARFNRADWPGPVLSLLLGGASPADVRVAAAKGTAIAQRDQGCTAAFWIGENELLRGRPQAARPPFEEAVKQCPQLFFEYSLAASELKHLGN